MDNMDNIENKNPTPKEQPTKNNNWITPIEVYIDLFEPEDIIKRK